MSKVRRYFKGLSFNIISAVVVLILVFSLIVSAVGYICFTNTLKREYKETTYNMTKTAAALVTGNKIQEYIASDDESGYSYATTKSYLYDYCNKMDVTIVHVIGDVDTETFKSAKTIFNLINDKNNYEITGKKGDYTPWNLNDPFEEPYISSYSEIFEQIYNREIEFGTVYRTKDLRGKDPHITSIVPINDSKGNIVALLSIQRPMKELVRGRRPYMIAIAITTLIMLAVVCTTAGLYIRLQFVKPINDVIDETKRFAKENKKSDLTYIKNSRIIEIKELSSSIDRMEDDMIRYIDSLTQATKEQKKMGVELNIAKKIQEGSVPNTFPAFPERTDFDLYACMIPAKEVGGDFYNFILVDDTHLAVIMADVAGKGVPAALFMMVSNIFLTERLRAGDNPAETLKYVNKRICTKNTMNMFVTVWVGIIDLETGNVIASNAGHDNPAVYRKNTNKFEILNEGHSLIVGAMEDADYFNYEFNLEKGDKLFLYTDGVPEATNSDNELFTLDRMVEALNKNKGKDPKETIRGVKKSVDEFVGNAPQFDDITMMLVEYKGKE